MEREAQGRFTRYKFSKPFFAIVTVTVEPATEPSIEVKCSGNFRPEDFMQGQIEDVAERGHNDWKAGGCAGVSYALRLAQAPPCRVTITKIEGLFTDTNPTIVGAAAAFAVWKALDYQPSQEEIQRLEEIVFSSWSLPDGAVPSF